MKHKDLKKNNYSINKFNMSLILVTLFCVIGLAIGYSAYNGEFSVSGEAVYRVEKEVRINDLFLSETYQADYIVTLGMAIIT